MAYERLIEKFIAGFNAIGIYIHDIGGSIVPISESDHPEVQYALLILRRHIASLKRTESYPQPIELKIEEGEFGLILDLSPSKKVELVILTSLKRMKQTQKAWKRFRPAIMKVFPFDEIVDKESIEKKLLSYSDEILTNLETAIVSIKGNHQD